MPLTEPEKNYIVENVVTILKSPDRKKQIAALRDKVLQEHGPDENLDDAIYAVLQAIDELYG